MSRTHLFVDWTCFSYSFLWNYTDPYVQCWWCARGKFNLCGWNCAHARSSQCDRSIWAYSWFAGWYGYFDPPTLGIGQLSKWDYLRDRYVFLSGQKKREERAGSAGATARVIIECTELVELEVQSYRRRGWIVLPTRRGIVLGPQSVEGINLPYKIRHVGSTIFWGCIFNKPIRA